MIKIMFVNGIDERRPQCAAKIFNESYRNTRTDSGRCYMIPWPWGLFGGFFFNSPLCIFLIHKLSSNRSTNHENLTFCSKSKKLDLKQNVKMLHTESLNRYDVTPHYISLLLFYVLAIAALPRERGGWFLRLNLSLLR